MARSPMNLGDSPRAWSAVGTTDSWVLYRLMRFAASPQRAFCRFPTPAPASSPAGFAPIAWANIRFDSTLSRSVFCAPQEPVLFAGTIRENIERGKPGATMAEIEAAAKSAFAHDFVETFQAGTHFLWPGVTFATDAPVGMDIHLLLDESVFWPIRTGVPGYLAGCSRSWVKKSWRIQWSHPVNGRGGCRGISRVARIPAYACLSNMLVGAA